MLAVAVVSVSIGRAALAEDTSSATEDDALAETLCRLNARVSPGRTPWTTALCGKLARAVKDSAARHELSPSLLVAVMLNESDLDEKAAHAYPAHGAIAKDSGLMGIRCRIGRNGRCTNALVEGMTWRQVMDPVTNIELGARYLELYRDGAGRERRAGKSIPCRHRDHAYWAHYNHGTHFISKGSARFYPDHVGVLEQALAETLNVAPASAAARYTLARLQRSERAGARRYLSLCKIIREAPPAFASVEGPIMSMP
jgi:hypothetical protein